jgi:hypothetical protein
VILQISWSDKETNIFCASSRLIDERIVPLISLGDCCKKRREGIDDDEWPDRIRHEPTLLVSKNTGAILTSFSSSSSLLEFPVPSSEKFRHALHANGNTNVTMILIQSSWCGK